MSAQRPNRSAIEAQFREVFEHLGFIAAYARRRGARDPDGIAAEVMAIAWRRSSISTLIWPPVCAPCPSPIARPCC